MLTISLAEASGYKIGVVPPRKPADYGCKYCPLRFMSKKARDNHLEGLHKITPVLESLHKKA
jgi:hypothetical protein